MGLQKVGCVIGFLIFLCALRTGGSEGRKRTYDFDSDGAEIDEDMLRRFHLILSEHMANCRLDLMGKEEISEAVDLCLQKETDSEIKLVTEGNIQKALGILPPLSKKTLLDCLWKQKIRFRVSADDDDYKSLYIKYLEYLFCRTDASRRHLGEKFFQYTTTTSISLSPPSVKSYARELSASPDDASDQPPPTPRRKPSSPPNSDSSEKPSAVKQSSASQDSSPDPNSQEHHTNNSIAIAVGITATCTFAFALLAFCCYHRRKNRIYSGYEQKDGKPLLNLRSSNMPAVPPKRSSTMKDLFKDEKMGSVRNNPSQHGRLSSFEGNLSVESSIQHSLPEGPSAASSNINAPGSSFPPLKPPPGRAVLSPPESTPQPSPSPQPPPQPPPLPGPRPLAPSQPKPKPQPPPPPPPGPHPPAPTSGPHPPPLPKAAVVPPRAPPPISVKSKPPLPGLKGFGNRSDGESTKTKLKPFFWDKVLAKPDRSMVWHEISSGSFQVDEEMMENLFGYAVADKNKNERKKGLSQDSVQYIQIIDHKKAQNISILLRALNVTTAEVCDALNEANELPSELLHTLLKMQPSAEEELKLRLYSGELSLLGPAERFLNMLVNIPFAFKRIDSLLFMNSFQEEITGIKESLETLEIASNELRNSRLFLKLLEAVLKTGNRMNDGTFRGGAQAFKLDTLLKLSDVKGTDGKTTLLHFVVQEIIRSEGIRAVRAIRESQSFSSVSDDLSEDTPMDAEDHYRSLGLQKVSGLSAELENVRKAAVLDTDGITSTVSKLGHALVRSRDFLNTEMKSSEEDSGFHHSLNNFVVHAEEAITWLLHEERRIMALMTSTVDYFHGSASKDEGFRIFVIVRDFLIILDKACKEVSDSRKMASRPSRNKDTALVPPSPDVRPSPSPSPSSSLDLRKQKLFPAIKERRKGDSSSDDDSP